MNPLPFDDVEKLGYNDEAFGFFNYRTDMHSMASSEKSYAGNYLGGGDNPSWMRDQATMGKVMGMVTSNTGDSYLDNVIHNSFHLREKLVGVPIAIIACKKLYPEGNMSYEKFLYEEAQSRPNFYAGPYSLQPVYEHDLNKNAGHSGASEATCVCNVITMTMNMIGVVS